MKTTIWYQQRNIRNNISTSNKSKDSSGKIDKCEYLTSKEIFSPDQKIMIEQTKFAYYPLSKAF